MLNWLIWNRAVWSFDCAYVQNMFTNHIYHIFNIHVKTGFDFE